MNRTVAVAAALILLPLPAAAQVATQPAVLVDGTILDVAVTGTTTRTPDIATIRAGVVTAAPTAAAAMGANADRMRAVIAALRRAGLAERDIQTAAIRLQPQYRHRDGQAPLITGYEATNTVSVRFRDIAASGRVLDALVTAGANQIDGPDLALDRPDAAQDAARTDAVTKARARAELYARAAGLRVDRIVSVSETGGYEPPMPMPVVMTTSMSARAADTEVAPGEQDVRVTLNVRFLLK